MGPFLSSGWTRAGLGLILLGWGPLLGIIALSSLGLWPDPHPNPIGCGLLFAITFLPALFCLGMGAYHALRRR
ncbi:MAG TPA: hypothetical protein VK188_16305 [Holophaga sp.]|nr:hypothetical protein [Holophaga sp.]